ncbi:MAG: S8 family serine peptidase, partial [Candidatus Natronoplasma sp.]
MKKRTPGYVGKENLKFLTFLCTLLLVISTLSVISGISSAEEDSEGQIVMVETPTGEAFDTLQDEGTIQVIDDYEDNVLVRVKDGSLRRLTENGIDFNRLPERDRLTVKGHSFNINEEEPELRSDLKIQGYGPDEEGLYIVHMLGPINPEWRKTLENKGVEIINYVPNYAYEVSMTSEQAKEVEDLFFVDWLGIYHPEYKLHQDVEPGRVNVHLRSEPDIQKSADLLTMSDDIDKFDLLESEGSIEMKVDSEEDLHELARINDVYYISPQVEPELQAEMDIQTIGGGLWFMDDGYGHPSIPYRKHGDHGAYINQIGYTGKENTIAVADSGIGDGTIGDAGVEDFTGRVVGGYGFGDDIGEWSDDMYHGTATTGLIAGDTYGGTEATYDEYDGFAEYYMGQGLSYESDLFAAKIFNADGEFLPDEYFEIVEEAEKNSDAYIHSNSWGADTMGQYIMTDSEFDKAVRDANRVKDGNQPMVITASAGNSGGSNMFEQEIGSPGNAKNLITVGGSKPYNPTEGYEDPENIYSASSRGWTEDNRIKPDVIAPAENIITQNTPLRDGTYVSSSGTSFSNPLVAGSASIVVDWYNSTYGEDPSPAMVKAILINTANDLNPEGTSRGHRPNRDEGWGMADISKLEYPTQDPIEFMMEDQSSNLATGEKDEYTVSYQNEEEPLKFTLSWTDEEAMEGDSSEGTPTLKNNLDIEVVSPTGKVYRGNAFDSDGDGESDSGFSYPNTETMRDFDHKDDGWDDVNNVENVFIPADKLEKGTYKVVVHGTNVPADANNDGEANQDYALTASNVPYVDEPSKDGTIKLNRNEYSGDD